MAMTTSSKTTTGEKVPTSNMIEKSKANSIPVEATILPATTNTSHTTARVTITASTTKMEKTTSIPIEKEKEMTTSVMSKTTMPRILCNGNGAISHLQTEMGFVKDFRYSLYN